MENQEKGLARIESNNFVTNSLATLEEAMRLAKVLLDSKLCPNHFYEKKTENGRLVPDYTKGKPEAVVMVMVQGDLLGFNGLQALQQIVPVNGLLSIKGDGARSLIFRSKKIKPGSWKEEVIGRIEDKTYEVRITASRVDTGETKTRKFSVMDAINAGLWITNEDVRRQPSQKYSSWYRYQKRMIYYRALGFLCRDLFPDVMQGMVTQEEAMDYPQEVVEITEAPGGGRIFREEPGEKIKRSEDLSKHANETIEDKKDLGTGESPQTDQVAHVYTEEELKKLGPKIKMIAEKLGIDKRIDEEIPGQRTNKKYREAILAWQIGKLDDHIGKSGGTPSASKTEDEKDQPAAEKKEGTTDQESSHQIEEFNENNAEEQGSDKNKSGDDDQESDDFQNLIGDDDSDNVSLEDNKNKFDLEIPDLDDGGNRDFDQVRELFYRTRESDIDLTNENYINVCLDKKLQTDTGKEMKKEYPTREAWLQHATVAEVNRVLNAI